MCVCGVSPCVRQEVEEGRCGEEVAPTAKAGRDRMRDRVAEYVARLRAMGKPVELAEFEGQGHGFFVFAPFGDASDELVRVVRQFMCTCTATSHG